MAVRTPARREVERRSKARNRKGYNAAARERYARDPQKVLARQALYAQANRQKRRAREAVKYALRTGRLVKGPCEAGTDCRGRVTAHHDDYSKPLDVRWLCDGHHGLEHRKEADG
jgi:hypothetical protein